MISPSSLAGSAGPGRSPDDSGPALCQMLAQSADGPLEEFTIDGVKINAFGKREDAGRRAVQPRRS